MTTPHNSHPDTIESLSALFDGEADGKDIDGLLDQDTASLSRKMESYHAIQQAIHKDADVSIGLGDSLVGRIRAQLEEESIDASLLEKGVTQRADSQIIKLSERVTQKVQKGTWRSVFSGMAVAASVAFVVILGGNHILFPNVESPESNNELADQTNALPASRITPLSELHDISNEDNERLQRYLRQHAEQATMTVGQGMIPMARVVSYPVKE